MESCSNQKSVKQIKIYIVSVCYGCDVQNKRAKYPVCRCVVSKKTPVMSKYSDRSPSRIYRCFSLSLSFPPSLFLSVSLLPHHLQSHTLRERERPSMESVIIPSGTMSGIESNILNSNST